MTSTLHCPVQAECGGCPWLHLPGSSQETQKRDAVVQAFHEAGLAKPRVEWRPSPKIEGYRNRLRLRVDSDGHVSYFNEEKSVDCLVLDGRLRAARSQLLSEVSPSSLRGLAHIELRVSDADSAVGLAATGALPGQLPELRRALPRDWRAAWRPDAGCSPMACDSLSYQIADGVFMRVPLFSFVQINSNMNRCLVESVVRFAHGLTAQTFADLFAGAGNFSLPLAASGMLGHAVEIDSAAMTALVSNAAPLPGNVTVEAVDAPRAVAALPKADLVIVNPPRAGLKDGHEALATRARLGIAWCCCNPRSMARDLAKVTRRGWGIRRLIAFDMFPHTRHVETLALLTPA